MAREKKEREDSDLIEKLVGINRVAKVVKGGRRFGFAALVVIGNGRGMVGFGSGRSREVSDAIRKGGDQARKLQRRFLLREGHTLHHDVVGRYGAARVVVRSAPPGTGIIAGGPARAVFEALGVKDVVAKSIRSSNPYNLIRATFDALSQCETPRQVAQRRCKKNEDILRQRRLAGGNNVVLPQPKAEVEESQEA
ncbi:MAG: 30S ribosomal protein S5 [Alphaproteobacteria bacterium]|nr:30S ribosomal protein S5 [Alphaproteobacteria bacterium]